MGRGGGGAMGKRMLRGWQGPKVGRWGGWTGRRGDGEGSNRDRKRVAMGRGTT